MTKASDNQFPKVIFVEGAAPGTPSAGFVYVYAKADGLMYSKDDAGVETLMSGGAGGGGAVATDTIWDAAGDLAVGTGANTAAKLAKGTGLQVLRVNSGATALEWATPSAGGLTQAYLGYNTVGGSWLAMVNDRHYIKKITLANDCLLAGIEPHVRVTTDAARALGALVLADAAGVPDYQIAANGVRANDLSMQSAAGGRWFCIPIGKWLTAGDYWIGVTNPSTGTLIEIAQDTSGGADRYYTPATDFFRDATGQSVTDDTPNRRSIRANTIR